MGGSSTSAEAKVILAEAQPYTEMPDRELDRLWDQALSDVESTGLSYQGASDRSFWQTALNRIKNEVTKQKATESANPGVAASVVVDWAHEVGLDLTANNIILAILVAMIVKAVADVALPTTEEAIAESQLTYRNFDLLIRRAEPGSYRAQVLQSPAGESPSAQFELPFSAVDLENLLLDVSQHRQGTHEFARSESAVEDIGKKLYRAVFQNELQDTLERSLSLTDAERVGMRLRLRLTDTPELARLPWELLYDPGHNRFLAQSLNTPLVRYLDLADSPQPLGVEGPLRLLVMTSSPSDYPPLNVEHEWRLLASALAQQQAEGQVVVRRSAANMSTLRQWLRREDFHVVHFIGHGRYRPDQGRGVLVMEGRAGRSQEVTGEELGVLLSESDQTRLVVLNACQSARRDASDEFGGVAQNLIQQGLPAVVATQFQITDDVATTFAQRLYSRLSNGFSLEAAVAEARGAIRADGNLTEWAAPVLYSRAEDGRLFDLTGQGGSSAADRTGQEENDLKSDRWGQVVEGRSPSGPGSAEPPPEADIEPPELFWNTRFPEDKGILLYQPHLVVARAEYLLETKLGTEAERGAEAKPQKAAGLLNKEIRFQLEAENGEFRLIDSTEWDIKAVSAPLVCTEIGTEAFRVFYRADKPGRAVIKAFLIVDNGSVDQHEIELKVEADGTVAEAMARTSANASPTRVVGRSVRGAPSPDYRFTIRRWFADLWHQNTQLVDVRLPAELAYQLTRVATDLYRELREISLICPLRSSPDRPLHLSNSDEGKLRLAKVGAELHYRLFRQPIQPVEDGFLEKMGAIADKLSVEGNDTDPPLLQIHACDYPLPWGLLYDRSTDGGRDLRTADDVDPAGFWGRRFDIYRSVVSVDRDPLRGERRWVKPVIGAYVPRNQEQRDFVDGLRADVGDAQIDVDSTSSTAGDLMDWAMSGKDSDLLYLFCHARPARYGGHNAGPATSWFGFGGRENDDGDELRVELEQLENWWHGQRQTNPIVILNACSSGQQDLIYGAPFVDFFLEKWEAQAFIGTDWPINASFADMFGRQILCEILERRRSLRDALRSVSDAAAEESNYFPLMYAIYGLSTIQFVDPPLVG